MPDNHIPNIRNSIYKLSDVRIVIIIWILCNGFVLNLLSQNKAPNFIIIYTDDQRLDGIGLYGNDVIKTPNLDKFLARGIIFQEANVVFSLCSPSRAALLTGRYGSQNGVLHLGSGLNSEEKTIAQYLQVKGYRAGISGKWHINQSPEELGFDFYNYFYSNGSYYNREINDNGVIKSPTIHCDVYCANRSVDFLNEVAESGQPFFLFHNTQLPHMDDKLEWNARESTLSLYDESVIEVPASVSDNLSGKPPYLSTVRNKKQALVYGYPDIKAIQRHTKEYYSVITEMDQALKPLLSCIVDLNLLKNTYVFFMSDNGWMLGEHGFTSKVLPYGPSTRVPFSVVGPGIVPGESTELVLNIDLMPTILALAGIQIPENLHGKSLIPIINGSNSWDREAVVYEGLGSYGGVKPCLMVYNGRYRYITTFEDDTLEKISYIELYDVKVDPLEMNNLSGSNAYESIINSMHKYVQAHKIHILGLKNSH